MNSLAKGCGDFPPFAHGTCSDQVGNGPKPGKSDGPGCSSSHHKQRNSCEMNTAAFTQKKHDHPQLNIHMILVEGYFTALNTWHRTVDCANVQTVP